MITHSVVYLKISQENVKWPTRIKGTTNLTAATIKASTTVTTKAQGTINNISKNRARKKNKSSSGYDAINYQLVEGYFSIYLSKAKLNK